MSKTRKINRTIAKNALKANGFKNPNMLKLHKEHGVNIKKYMSKYIKNGYSGKKRRW